jgi:DNA-binding PadR family transcriptional regulator
MEECMATKLTQRVKELSEERILLTEGALYPALHKLEAEGMLNTEVVTRWASECENITLLHQKAALW